MSVQFSLVTSLCTRLKRSQ